MHLRATTANQTPTTVSKPHISTHSLTTVSKAPQLADAYLLLDPFWCEKNQIEHKDWRCKKKR